MRNIRKSSRDFLGVGGGGGGVDILVLRFAPIPLSTTATPPTFDLSDLRTRLDHPVTWNPGAWPEFFKGGGITEATHKIVMSTSTPILTKDKSR